MHILLLSARDSDVQIVIVLSDHLSYEFCITRFLKTSLLTICSALARDTGRRIFREKFENAKIKGKSI